jgi:para-aminobenzoate synthetase component 1
LSERETRQRAVTLSDGFRRQQKAYSVGRCARQAGSPGVATLTGVPAEEPLAYLGGHLGRGLVEVSDDLAVLDGPGWWAVVVEYEGAAVCARFADVRPTPQPGGPWVGPARPDWTSSMDRAAYLGAVQQVRTLISAGEVYQANVCRVLRARLPDGARCDVAGLAMLLAQGNPAPYAGFVRLPPGCHPGVPADGVLVATASPELFLQRDGRAVASGPIKGTGRTEADLQDKDVAENVMIVDLVRNDLGAVCRTGSVRVPALLRTEQHPGLVHLVSTVTGELADGVGWPALLAATFPPGSVTGAPKSSAVQILDRLEPVPRGPYCGAVGWCQDGRGVLAVGIRTFWLKGGAVHFGTGAGITWGSDPAGEWAETELKASTLLRVAAGTWQAPST